MSRTEAHYPESRRDYRQDKTRRERIRDRLAADPTLTARPRPSPTSCSATATAQPSPHALATVEWPTHLTWHSGPSSGPHRSLSRLA